MRVSTSPQNAVRLQETLSTVDIRERLRLVRVPTLVIHSRHDGRVSYPRGLELARGIPNARLLTLESRNHLILEHEAGVCASWRRYSSSFRVKLPDLRSSKA